MSGYAREDDRNIGKADVLIGSEIQTEAIMSSFRAEERLLQARAFVLISFSYLRHALAVPEVHLARYSGETPPAHRAGLEPCREQITALIEQRKDENRNWNERGSEKVEEEMQGFVCQM